MPLPSTGDFTSPQMAQRIVDEALVLSEGFRDAFTQAISEIVESAELIQLLQDIQAGQFVGLTPGVLDIIDAVEIEPDEMLRIQREALAQAADITNQETGLDFRFDIINPRAAQAALNIGSYLVRYVNDSVRERLREIIAEQVSGLLSVADARRMIRDRVGLLPQHAVAVQNYEAGLLASGMDPTRVQTLAARYSERLLRYRAEMISRTEVARATSVGQQEYWLQARDAGRLPPNTMRIWIVNIDELTCDICRPMQDSDPIGLEDYWTTVEGDTVYYPTQSHPNCRCTTGLVFPDLMNKVDPTGYERWLMTRPVQKHAEHDQQSHGNWARGRSGKFVGTETIGQLKEMGLEGDELQEALRSVREARESGRQEVGIVASRRGGFTTLTIYDTDNIWGKEGEVDIPVPEFWVSADNAYTTWSAYEGNYQIRKMSAVMMGLDVPKAEKGNFENPLFRAEVFGVDQLDEDERADLAVHHLYAEAMVSAIADADVTSRPLYRGLGDVPADSPIRNLQPGDEFSAPVSAWSDGRGLAEQFSGSGSDAVLLVMDGPKRAWKPEEYYYGAAIGEGDPFGEEVLSQGEFRVTGSETLPDGTLQVTVEQTYTYDIGGRSREVEKASKKRAIPEWVMELMAGSVRQPVKKHANHDQKSHGNWARQGQLPGIDWDGFKISDMERLKRSIGLRPDQEIWQHPVMREAFWRGEVPDDEWEAQYQVIEYVEGEWAKFGPARQIRDAAEKLLGLEEPEQGDPTLDPYQESGLDPGWGGGEARVSDEEARVMALWFLEQSAQVEGKFYRGTEASVERMGLSEGDEFDVGLLSFAGYPQTAARFGTETIFVVENPIGYQGERLDMDVRYTAADADEFYNVVRTHAERDELQDMYGEDIFVVGEAVSEDAHPDVFYGGFDNRSEGLDTEFLLTGSYRIASIEQFNRGAQEEFYVTDKGEVPEVVSVVTLQPIDRDGDGIILEGTDEERFVGKAEKSRRPAWLRLFELSLGEMALASGAVKKHAEHDQQSHGNWARTGSATPKEMRERFDGRLPMLDDYRNRSGLASVAEYGTGSSSFWFGSLPTVDSSTGYRLILGKNSTAQQEWEDGYLDDKRGTYVDGMEGPVNESGWWTNIGAWHQRMLSAAILGLEVPEAIPYELVSEWSPLTAELVITGELTGEAVDAYMDDYWGKGNYTNADRNEEIEAAEWFVADQLQRSWKALAAAGHNPPIDYKLYRVVQNLNPDSELMNLKPGDTYYAPLGSYSAYTYMANDFLNRGANDERPEVVITVKPGARGATYDGIGRGEFAGGGLPDEIGGPLEAVIAGKFQVTEVRVATDGTRHIEVAQVEYPDVKTGYEEKLTFFTASDTQSEQSRQEIKNNLPRDADGDGIIFEGTPRERFTPLVAPVEKAGSRPRVPAWFFDDFVPAEPHSDDALSKHANHDQKSHGNWAQGKAKFNYRDWSQYKGNYIQRQLSAKAMGLPFYEVVRYNAESAWDESLPETTTGRGIDPEMQAAVDGDLSQLNDTQRKRFIRQQQSVEGALQELRDTDLVKDRPLFRGLLDADPESSLFTTPVGEALRLPLSAFSSDAKVARSFAGLKRGREESAGLAERPEVMIVLAPGARILKHGQFRNSPMVQYRDESTGELRTKRTHMFFEESGERVFDTIENVTAGEFRITNRKFYESGELGGYGSQPHWVIEIEHTGVFNPDTGNFDPIDRDGDGIVFEGTDQERFVGKHADHDQKSHGNWATGRATPKRFDRFTEGGGQRPGKRLYKMDGVWHQDDVRIRFDDPTGGSRSLADSYLTQAEAEGIYDEEIRRYGEVLYDDFEQATQIIVDALNDVSPEFRPTAIRIRGDVEPSGRSDLGDPPVGGAMYDPSTDEIVFHPAALGLTRDTLFYAASQWGEVVSPGLNPASLRKLMIHELAHSIDWKIHQRTRVRGESSWYKQRNQLASDWFEASEDLLDPEGPTTWYLHLNFTEADRYGGANKPQELFAEWFANGFFSTPIPNSQMVDEVVNNLDLTNVLVPRDGDGDGLVFDGTGRERSA